MDRILNKLQFKLLEIGARSEYYGIFEVLANKVQDLRDLIK